MAKGLEEASVEMEIFAAPKLNEVLQDTLSSWVLLIVVIALMIGAIVWIRSLLSEDDDPAIIDHQMLSEIAELQRTGDLTEEEYRSIKGRITSR